MFLWLIFCCFICPAPSCYCFCSYKYVGGTIKPLELTFYWDFAFIWISVHALTRCSHEIYDLQHPESILKEVLFRELSLKRCTSEMSRSISNRTTVWPPPQRIVCWYFRYNDICHRNRTSLWRDLCGYLLEGLRRYWKGYRSWSVSYLKPLLRQLKWNFFHKSS